MKRNEGLTVQEAAERLGMSVSWLYKQTAAKTIPHYKFGAAVRFSPEQVDAFKATRERAVIG